MRRVPGTRFADSTEEKFARGSAQTRGPRGAAKLAGRIPRSQELSLIGKAAGAAPWLVPQDPMVTPLFPCVQSRDDRVLGRACSIRIRVGAVDAL